MFGLDFINGLINKTLTSQALDELNADSGGPFMALSSINDPSTDAGAVRLWRGTDDSLIDRMIHFRLVSDPVDTQLFFLFGRSATPMPHFQPRSSSLDRTPASLMPITCPVSIRSIIPTISPKYSHPLQSHTGKQLMTEKMSVRWRRPARQLLRT